MRSRLQPLRFRARAELFIQLAAMEDGGLPLSKALALVQLPGGAEDRLARMRQSLALGFDVGDAGLRSGLFTSWEASLIRTAFNAGNAGHVYRRLATLYGGRAERLAAMKSRLMMPAAMLLVAIFVQPLPRLIAGSLSVARYASEGLMQVVALCGLGFFLTEVPQRGGLEGAPRRMWDRLIALIPRFGPMQERRGVRDFLEGLALLVEAGMPILDALPLATAQVRTAELRQRLSCVRPSIESGASFTLALGAVSFRGRARAIALIGPGEASGSLADMLMRYVDMETSDIESFDDAVAVWTPRLVYLISALSIGYGIVHGGAFLPALPPDAQ